MEENKIKEHPKVFISYAWTNEQHKEEIRKFTNKLRENGIDAKLDQLELYAGQDMNKFMESNIINEEIDKVLIISNKEYVDKANARKGGVGTETQIISQEVYENTEQKKFIPIIWEKDENGKPYLPTYLVSRKGFDLSDENKRKEKFFTILKEIVNIPIYSKSKLGKLPKELIEGHNKNFGSENYILTKKFLDNFQNQVNQNPNSIDIAVTNILKRIFENIKEYKIEFSKEDNQEIIGKKVCESIESYYPVRNQYILFLEKFIQIDPDKINTDLIIDFLVNLHSLTVHTELGQSHLYDYFNFDFFLRELFLYTIFIPLKYKNYEFVSDILYSPYYFKQEPEGNESKTFTHLDNRGRLNLDDVLKYYYNNKINEPNLLSPLADLLIKNIDPKFDRDDLVDADILCCYVSNMHPEIFEENGINYDWFPFTYPYKENENFDLIRKLTSKKHFEKTKCLFQVETVDELKQCFVYSNSKLFKIRYNRYLKRLHILSEYVNIDKIGTVR